MRAASLPPCPPLAPVIGHRGAAASAPENTLAGMRRAKALGCAWVEFDVRLTADGALVLCHDNRLDRTTSGRGRVSAYPLQDICQYDAGAWFGPDFAGERVPTLDDALDLAIEIGLGTNIEIKADRGAAASAGAAVAAALDGRRGRLPPVLVSSFLPASLAEMRRLLPDIPRGLLLRLLPQSWKAAAARLDCATIHINHQRLRAPLAAAIRAVGYPLLAHTVNSAARAQQLFDWGVTSVFSDNPDIILAEIAKSPPQRAPDTAIAGIVPVRQGAFR